VRWRTTGLSPAIGAEGGVVKEGEWLVLMGMKWSLLTSVLLHRMKRGGGVTGTGCGVELGAVLPW
jgi:hypothetical protein